MKLNLGCGHWKMDGYINVDADPTLNPDLVLDLTQHTLPYEDQSIEEVTLIHTIEHFPRTAFPLVLGEINRVLIMEGVFIVSYPDARKILENYLSNKQGMREYWEMTIFGRGRTIWDMHRSLVLTEEFNPLLREFGFGKLRIMEEVTQSHNTIIKGIKVFQVIEKTTLLRKELNLDAGLDTVKR